MDLESFLEDISPKIVNRGINYFENGAVENLVKISESEWRADVIGSEDYRVEITIDDGEIIDWYCTCPYDWGPVCKHVVAVLYEIEKAMNGNEINVHGKKSKKQKKAEKSQLEQFEEILKKVSKKDLAVFLKEFALDNEKFFSEFFIHFSDLIKTNKKENYKTWIKEIARSFSGRYGFIEYNESFPLFRQVDSLLRKAEKYFDENNTAEAIRICQAVIEEVPVIVQKMDDSAGFSSATMDWAFSLIHKNLSKIPPSEKDALLDYCLKEFFKSKYTGFGWENDFLSLMPHLISNLEQEKAFFKALDLAQRKAGKGDSWSSTYKIVRLKRAKLDYFLITKRKEEATKFAEENIEHDEFRKFLIDEAIEKREFDRAKKLIHGGIDEAQKNNYPGLVQDYKSRLLEIARLEKNKDEVRKYAEELFYSSYFNFKFYDILKKTYSKDEWEDVVEDIIDEIKSRGRSGGSIGILAQVFIKEKYQDRLLKLLQEHSDDLHIVENYATHLKKAYPKELLKIYENAVRVYAQNTGRNFYEEIARVLKNMLKIEGGEKVVRKLVAEFKEKYPRRRAMMEILNKYFK
ncbi:hypothetical protein B6D60_09705 [candidate division KSB1 bacterium 4484_87]|nr:MAG: hypothetical protein B6D60_09705 [candidate division KSB1 bacterium 4484_87]